MPPLEEEIRRVAAEDINAEVRRLAQRMAAVLERRKGRAMIPLVAVELAKLARDDQ